MDEVQDDPLACYQHIQHYLNGVRANINPATRYIFVEYEAPIPWNEVLKEDRIYRISTRLSEFKHASLVVLKETAGGDNYEGKTWDLSERNKEAHLGDSPYTWEFKKNSMFQAVGFTTKDDEEIDELAHEYVDKNDKYHLLRNNCENFAKGFARILHDPGSTELFRSHLKDNGHWWNYALGQGLRMWAGDPYGFWEWVVERMMWAAAKRDPLIPTGTIRAGLYLLGVVGTPISAVVVHSVMNMLAEGLEQLPGLVGL